MLSVPMDDLVKTQILATRVAVIRLSSHQHDLFCALKAREW